MIIAFVLAIAYSLIINNVILMQYLGICPYLGLSSNIKSSIGMGAAVIFVIVLAAAVTYPIYLLLIHFNIAYMSTLVFILVIASLVQFIEMFIKKFSKPLYKALGVYLPLITTNCAVLGVAVQNTMADGFGSAMANALGTSLGFALVLITFAAIRMRLETSNIPTPFKGVPIALITTSIMALAFLGITGMISI